MDLLLRYLINRLAAEKLENLELFLRSIDQSMCSKSKRICGSCDCHGHFSGIPLPRGVGGQT
jgi:hypothetical protein